MFVFTGNPEHSFLFFYAKKSKHGTLCRLMKLNSSEHNGQSFLSCVLELDVFALPQLGHILYIFFKCFKDEFAFNSWYIFHAKSVTIHVPFQWTLFEVFFKLNWTEHTHMHKSVNQCTTHKLNGKENLAQLSSVSVSTMPRWCSPAVLLDYQCSGVMGLASQDKTNPDEMNHVGAERAALYWWKKPSHSERWDCNSVVLTWVTWLTAWTPPLSV